MSKFKVIHERPDCIACGACAAAAPTFFEMNEEDGLADLIDCVKVGENEERIISQADLDVNKEAAQVCPVQIIHIKKVDDDENEIEDII